MLNWSQILFLAAAAPPAAVLLLIVYRLTTPQSKLHDLSERLFALRRDISSVRDDARHILKLEKEAVGAGFRMLFYALPGAAAALVVCAAVLLMMDPWAQVYPMGDAEFFGWRPRWYWIFLAMTFVWGIPLKKKMRIR